MSKLTEIIKTGMLGRRLILSSFFPPSTKHESYDWRRQQSKQPKPPKDLLPLYRHANFIFRTIVQRFLVLDEHNVNKLSPYLIPKWPPSTRSKKLYNVLKNVKLTQNYREQVRTVKAPKERASAWIFIKFAWLLPPYYFIVAPSRGFVSGQAPISLKIQPSGTNKPANS